MPDLIGRPYKPASERAPAGARRVPGPSPPALPKARRPLYRKKRVLLPLGLALVLLGALAATRVAVQRAEERRQTVEAERARFAALLAAREARYLQVPLLSDRQRGLLRRSRNALHVETARRLGVASVAARRDVLGRAAEAGLIRLGDSPYYWVGNLTYSVPYVTPSAAAVLDSIGVRFQQKLAGYGLPPYQFFVSSVLRTQEDQAALRRVNVNAARSTSSHEFGTTFDLQFRRYRYAGDPAAELWEPAYPFLRAELTAGLDAFYRKTAETHASRLLALLGEALIELEDEGLLLTVMERRQPVFHTTVARRLVEG